MTETTYDNSNVAESFAGVTTPLTFSFARHIYHGAYSNFARMMGVSDKTIRDNAATFEHIIEFIGYRVYYNLNSWHTMLSLFPAYSYSKIFSQKMMGSDHSAQFDVPIRSQSLSRRLHNTIATALQTLKIAVTFALLGWRMRRFSRYFKDAYAELEAINMDELNLYELERLCRIVETRFLAQWKDPIANDFAIMVSAGAADSLFKKWLGSDDAYAHITAASKMPLSSLDPGNEIMHIASAVRNDERILSLFQATHSDEQLLAILRENHADHPAVIALESYIRTYGMRMPNELKLESATLFEEPWTLIAIIRQNITTTVERSNARKVIDDTELLKLNIAKRWLLRRLLRWASNSIHHREESRFYRTLVFGYIRRNFTAIGKKMAEQHMISDERDVFMLTIDDIFQNYDKENAREIFTPIIERRKREKDLRKKIDIQRHIVSSKNIPELERELQHTAAKQDIVSKLPRTIQGRVASRPRDVSKLSGTALTLKDFDSSAQFEGKILVTCQTDPGWTIMFPFLKGIVIERGGMLSHASIVARELNIPCIVAAHAATDTILDGAEIVLDLQLGTVDIV